MIRKSRKWRQLGAQSLAQEPHCSAALQVAEYQQAMEQSWVWSELHQVRNVHPSFHRGLWLGTIYSAIETFVLKGRVTERHCSEPASALRDQLLQGWWTFRTTRTDSESTLPAADCTPIEVSAQIEQARMSRTDCVQYPKPDGEVSFDLLTNLQRSGTYHDDDQPAHLKIKPELAEVPKVRESGVTGELTFAGQLTSFQKFGAPETRFCPAKVCVREKGLGQRLDSAVQSFAKEREGGGLGPATYLCAVCAVKVYESRPFIG